MTPDAQAIWDDAVCDVLCQFHPTGGHVSTCPHYKH